MISIPTRTIDFKSGNSWGIYDGVSESLLSYPRLLHAAMTVGHRNSRSRSDMLGEDDWVAEMQWKRAAFVNGARMEGIAHSNVMCPVDRLVPRMSRQTIDPSEKVDLSRQFGMAMAAAWVRANLGVPWLLHLDVYKEAFGVTLPPGEKPDLVGRHADGRWIVVESKCFARKPTRTQQSHAKTQAGRISSIGGVTPDIGLAILSFFASDNLAVQRPKPKVVNMWVVDPPPEEGNPDEFNPKSFSLPGLTPEVFLKLYYEQWMPSQASPVDFVSDGAFSWWSIPGETFRIGILSELLPVLHEGDVIEIPRLVEQAERRLPFSSLYPSWSGDGIVLETI